MYAPASTALVLFALGLVLFATVAGAATNIPRHALTEFGPAPTPRRERAASNAPHSFPQLPAHRHLRDTSQAAGVPDALAAQQLPSVRSKPRAMQAAQKQGVRKELTELLGVGVPLAEDDVDQSRVLRQNLAEDMYFWKERPKVKISDLMRLAVSELVTFPRNVRRLVLIQNNTLTFPMLEPGNRTGCNQFCDQQMAAITAGFLNATRDYKLVFPDVLAVISVDDFPPCVRSGAQPPNVCSAPVISLGKQVATHPDLLAPTLTSFDAQAVEPRTMAWVNKSSKAFWRGAGACGTTRFDEVCARTWMSRLASTNYSDRIDAGIVEEYFRIDQRAYDAVLRDGHGPLPVAPFVPHSALPRYRYLLHLDGGATAYRLSLLLATNSVVLKQESPWVEWYYRSLQPWVHYIPILTTSLWDAFSAMAWVDANQEAAQAIAHRALRFALRYTTFKARLVYWVYVLHAYKALFEDQEEWLNKLKGLDGDGVQRVLLSAVPQA